MLLEQSNEASMPLPLLQLLRKFVVLGGGKLHVPLRKNVPEVNVVRVMVPGDLYDKASGVRSGLCPLWSTGTHLSLLRGHLQKTQTKYDK